MLSSTVNKAELANDEQQHYQTIVLIVLPPITTTDYQ